MTLIANLPASTTLLEQLINPAVRALILFAVVAFGLAAFRVKSTSLRLLAWTSVLYAALAMPALQWMLPPLPIPAPHFLRSSSFELSTAQPGQRATPLLPASSRAVQPQATPAMAALRNPDRTAPPATPSSTAPRSLRSAIPWPALAVVLYISVALILLLRLLIGIALGRRLVRSSLAIEDQRLTVKVASFAGPSKRVHIARLAESPFISTPLTIGALRSTILLPSDWRRWDDQKLDAVLAHELSHVTRRDALTQGLSLLHRAIFWFSPLAWWLNRHLADLAEQASDEAALACGADQSNYARTLLGFFAALQTSQRRVWWQGVSMAKAGQAEKRVERILSWKGAVPMGVKKSFAVAILAFALPATYLVASVHAANPRPQAADAPQAQPSVPAPLPEASPAPEVESQADVTSEDRDDNDAPPAPVTPPMPTAPTVGAAGGIVAPAPIAHSAPVAAIAPVSPVQSSGRGFSYHYGFDDEQRFVIVSGQSDSFTMSGSTEDARHVQKLRKNIAGDFIWFQRDEKSYVIRDQATIDRARKLWEPQEELGRKQEVLGKQQEALGKQQQELGARMEQIRVNVPDMTAELEKLKAELKQLSSGATSEQVGHIQSEIGELQSKIGEVQSHAGSQQGKLGEEMGALGAQQGKLGAQQGELGRQQAQLAREATEKMKQLLDEAIQKGTAQPEL